jgi:sirohydrochlorin cobaltochelatase
MPISNDLKNLVLSGVHRMGQLEIQSLPSNGRFSLCHLEDFGLVDSPEANGLEVFQGPSAARDLSTYAPDGSYRFTKGQTNLKRGWVMYLENEEELRQALDQFYPAGVGLFLAHRKGILETENLRNKLNRQTGMYRFARNVSDSGAQELVRTVCGPAHQCAKRILWRIDDATPLEPSEASLYDGIPGAVPETEAIPLLCREACNHFVAECRRVAKEEFGKKSASAD